MFDRRKAGFHNLRRNDGVVMFIVISTMTLMIIVAMSFWVAVSSEMTDIKEDFSVEQTYQAAVSVNEWVYDYFSAYMGIADSLSNIETDCPLLHQILTEMNVGDVMSTGAISGMEGYGDCNIDISLVDVQEAANHKTLYFNIVSSVTNGANYESFTRSCALEIIKMSVPYSIGGEEFFEYSLSTTGSTSESKLEGYAVTEPIYLGNDNVRWKDGKISADLNTYGSFETTGGFYFNTDTSAPIKVNIGKNLIHTNSGPVMPCGGLIRVAGYFKTDKPIDGHTTFYILGEELMPSSEYAFYKNNDGYSGGQVFYVNGGVYINRSTKNCDFFINGNLTIANNSSYEYGTFYVAGDVTNNDRMIGGKVYYTGTYSGPTSWYVGGTLKQHTDYFEQVTEFPWGGIKAWPEKDSDINVAAFPGRDYESMQTARFNVRLETAELLRDAEGNIEYDVNGDPLPIGPKEVPEWSVMDRLEELSLGGDIDAAAALGLIQSNRLEIGNNDAEITITKSGYISLTAAGNNTKTILIDTMAEADDMNDPLTHKDIYIRLCANSEVNTFKWKNTDWGTKLNIVVRGAGSVIFFLDNGIKYKPDKNIFIGHEGWLKYFGLANNSDTISWFNANKTSVMNALGNLVHDNEICGKAECLYCKDLDPAAFTDAVLFPGRFVLRQDEEVNIIEQFSGGPNPVFLHNNIFFIDNNQPTNSEFYGTNTIFFGYAYAPGSKTTLPNESGWSLAAGAFILGGINCSGNAQNDFGSKHIMPAGYYPFSRMTLMYYIGEGPGGGTPVGYADEYVPSSLGTKGYS